MNPTMKEKKNPKHRNRMWKYTRQTHKKMKPLFMVSEHMTWSWQSRCRMPSTDPSHAHTGFHIYDSFCLTYCAAPGTPRWPTQASPPSSSLLFVETAIQQNDLLLVEKSASDITSAFLKSWEILNFEALRAAAQKRWSTFSPYGCLLLQTLSPHWEQLKKDAGAQKKMLGGHWP